MTLRDGKSYPTGYYFNELTVPVRKLVDRGYEWSSPTLRATLLRLDKRSDSPRYFQNDRAVYESYRTFHDGLKGLKKPEQFSAVIQEGLDQYAAVFFPRGHVFVLATRAIQDPDVGKDPESFSSNRKQPSALICPM